VRAPLVANHALGGQPINSPSHANERRASDASYVRRPLTSSIAATSVIIRCPSCCNLRGCSQAMEDVPSDLPATFPATNALSEAAIDHKTSSNDAASSDHDASSRSMPSVPMVR
jgi:hypothetical protein